MIVQYVEVGLKRLATLPYSMLKKVLTVMVEVDIGLISSFLSPIIRLILVDHWCFIVMVMTEVDIGLRPNISLHITMVN